ncbi:MAG: MFS transporter, partial [Thermotogaceae bacterium]|nr:MFS transporter [Thermotogaceae bacterium]
MAKFKKDFQFVRFAAYGFLKNLNFYEPFFILYFRSLGLSFLHIGFLFSISEVSTYILEIPTGIVADLYGRRRSMVFSMASYIVAFLIFYFFHHFWMLSLGMILIALGDTFRTGTHKSMIYEYLKINNMYDLKVEYYGATRSFSQLGSAFNAILSAIVVIFTKNYRNVFLFALIPYTLNLINLATYPKYLEGEVTLKKKSKKKAFLDFISVLKNWKVLKPIINSAIFDGSFGISKSYLQPVLKTLALSLPIFLGLRSYQRTAIVVGIVYFFVYLMTSYASRSSGKFVKKVKSIEFAVNSIFIFAAISILLSGISMNFEFPILTAIFFVVIYVLQNLRKPLMVAYISERAPSSALTSTLSVESQIKTIFKASMAPLVGYLADIAGVGGGLTFAGVAML